MLYHIGGCATEFLPAGVRHPHSESERSANFPQQSRTEQHPLGQNSAPSLSLKQSNAAQPPYPSLCNRPHSLQEQYPLRKFPSQHSRGCSRYRSIQILPKAAPSLMRMSFASAMRRASERIACALGMLALTYRAAIKWARAIVPVHPSRRPSVASPQCVSALPDC